jgi:cytochrome c
MNMLAKMTAAVIISIGLTSATLAQDATAGATVFRQCAICHSIGPNAANKMGPELNGLDGRHSASAAKYSYSDAMKKSGIVWNEQTFKQFIAAPQKTVSGTKMPFAGLKDPKQINDIWAYLDQYNADGSMKK